MQTQTNNFATRFRESLQHATYKFPAMRVAKNQHVYICGDPADNVYFVQTGQVKLLMLSPEGKECLLTIHTVDDTFGELCLVGPGVRRETATAMQDATILRIPRATFLAHLTRHSLVESFLQYLTTRMGDQQRIIANLVTVNSAHRLGGTLLLLAQKLGQPDPRSTRIEQRITHEELSEMVGTTRPRITQFMLHFRALGLIEITPERFLIVKERKLSDYLNQMA
jgi:CRP/FNR family cyclic AMP-dependent transcriptional regulator